MRPLARRRSPAHCRGNKNAHTAVHVFALARGNTSTTPDQHSDPSPAAGRTALLLHWNGTKWARVPGPSPGLGDLTGVAATSASNAWTVGRFATTVVSQALAIHCC
jgi:hypothetical protein